LSPTGRDIKGAVHARVQDSGPRKDGLTLVRFTSVPVAIQKYFEELLPEGAE
jgi:hypothetical protein